jgi:BirA family biotin operon repressor/biotin-[acetyl-CoA-carboxylase] ligase
MDVAVLLARRGAPHGTLVEAAVQTAGRGRMGRQWIAPAGSAFLGSLLLRVPSGCDAGALSPAMAAAVLRAIDALAPGALVQFKWPNDVLIDGRKVAGILLTARTAARETIVIAGTGVNVSPASVPAKGMGTCLAEWAPVTIAAVRERLVDEIGAMWDAFVSAGTLPERERQLLEARMIWRGAPVEMQMPEGLVAGVMSGIAPGGGARFRPNGAGQEQILHVGEVVRGPREATQAG